MCVLAFGLQEGRRKPKDPCLPPWHLPARLPTSLPSSNLVPGAGLPLVLPTSIDIKNVWAVQMVSQVTTTKNKFSVPRRQLGTAVFGVRPRLARETSTKSKPSSLCGGASQAGCAGKRQPPVRGSAWRGAAPQRGLGVGQRRASARHGTDDQCVSWTQEAKGRWCC